MPSLRAPVLLRKPTRPAQAAPPPTDGLVDCAVYVDGRRQGACSPADALADVRRRGTGFVWVGLHAPDEAQMEQIASTFGLHELAVEDAVHAHQRPKLERYDDTLFLVLKTLAYVQHETLQDAKDVVVSGELMVFMGADFVITVRHGTHTELAGVRRTLEADPEHLTLGPSVVMHALADHVVDSYVVLADALETDIDAMEEGVFSPGNSVGTGQIYLLKREVVEFRRSVAPLGAPLGVLSSARSTLVPKEVRRYFRDVDDHQTSVAERVSGFDEVLTSLVDAALAKVSVQQNNDMRKIAAYAAIITVPTLIAGIFGMNFDPLPGLHSADGFWISIAAMVVICTGMWVGFRRSGWL